MENYEFGETYRVPRGAGVSLDTVEQLTSIAVDILDFNDVWIPSGVAGVTADENLRQYKDSIRNNGRWVTNQDESGLILVDEFKNTVVKKDGKTPIELTWDELRGGGPLRDAVSTDAATITGS